MGRKLGLGEGAVGSVLAAVGTALPETLIPIIAIVFATAEGAHEVGVGAILGAPFMLSTLAMFVTGVGVFAFRARRATGTTMAVDTGVLSHDLRYFFVGYGLAVGAAFLPPDLSAGAGSVAIVLIGLYAWYVKGHLSGEAGEHSDDLAPLRMHRSGPGRPPARSERPATACHRAPGHRRDRADHRRRGLLHRRRQQRRPRARVSARCCSRSSSRRSPPSCPRSSTRSSGCARTRTRSRSATSPARWSSSRRSRPSSVWCFAADTWVVGEGSYTAFASAAIALIATAVIFIPARRRGRPRGQHLLVGGLFYLGYLMFVIGLIAGVVRRAGGHRRRRGRMRFAASSIASAAIKAAVPRATTCAPTEGFRSDSAWLPAGEVVDLHRDEVTLDLQPLADRPSPTRRTGTVSRAMRESSRADPRERACGPTPGPGRRRSPAASRIASSIALRLGASSSCRQARRVSVLAMAARARAVAGLVPEIATSDGIDQDLELVARRAASVGRARDRRTRRPATASSSRGGSDTIAGAGRTRTGRPAASRTSSRAVRGPGRMPPGLTMTGTWASCQRLDRLRSFRRARRRRAPRSSRPGRT